MVEHEKQPCRYLGKCSAELRYFNTISLSAVLTLIVFHLVVVIDSFTFYMTTRHLIKIMKGMLSSFSRPGACLFSLPSVECLGGRQRFNYNPPSFYSISSHSPPVLRRITWEIHQISNVMKFIFKLRLFLILIPITILTMAGRLFLQPH